MSGRIGLPGCVVLAAALALGGLPATAGAADEAAADPSSEPLRFRRIYAPADRVRDWPRGNVRYVPIEPDEFERLVEAVRSVPRGATSAVARVVQAHYEARLNEPDLLSGRVRIEVHHPARGAALLPLDPCGLAIEAARWEDPAAPPAVIGADPQGKFAVLVERPGNLLSDWSLRGYRDATGGVGFSLELPRCPLSTLLLELPETLVPICTAGVVAGEAASDDGWRRWRIELGGQNRVTLRVVSRDATSERRRLALMQEDLSYEFSSMGLDVRADLKLDVHNEPLRRLAVVLDPGLQFASAHYGDLEVPWSSSTDQRTGESRVLLEFGEPILGSGRTLRLAALAPLVTDRHWALPRMRPVGVFWQEASATLLVPAPLSLRALLLEGCRQSRIGPLPEPLDGESIELQFFSPDARAEVELSRSATAPHLDSSIQIDLGEKEMAGTLVGQFELSWGDRMTLAAQVDSGWVIDSVKSYPETAVDTWELASGFGSDLLTVRLKERLSSAHPVRLIVQGRADLSAFTRVMGEDELRMLSFQDVRRGRLLLCARTSGPYRLRLRGDPATGHLDPKSLTEAERALFADEPRGLLLDRELLRENWGLWREKQAPRFTAEVSVEALADAGKLVENYSIRGQSEASPMERLVVHFTRRRTGPLEWTLAGNEARLMARRWSVDEQAEAGLDSAGESWEVRFEAPRLAFALTAIRSSAFTEQADLSLLVLPEASGQQATLSVRAAGGLPLSIRNRRLEAVTSPAAPPLENSSLRGSYRYDPAAELERFDRPAITLARPGEAGSRPSAFAWSCELDSRFDSTGQAVHLATYRLQSDGQPSCTITLPGDARLTGVWVDDRQVTASAEPGPLVIPLPDGRRFPLVAVQYTTRGDAFGLAGVCRARWPTINLTTLSRRSTVWIAPGYELLTWSLPEAAAPVTWSQRLFAAFGRPAATPPFEPLAADDWLRLSGRSARRDWADATGSEFLRRLGNRLKIDDRGKPLDWGSLLESVDRPPELGILIDTIALAQAGVYPTSPVEAADAPAVEDPTTRGGSLLQQAGLVVIVRGGRLVLTSASAAAGDMAGLTSLEGASLYWSPSALEAEGARGTDRQRGRFVAATTWTNMARGPWSVVRPAGSGEADHLGWRAYHFDSPGDDVFAYRVVRSAAVRSAGWSILAIMLALGCWPWRGRPRWLLVGSGVFAAVALLLPAALAPIAAGALLGSLGALAWGVVVSARAPGLRSTDSPPAPAAVAAGAAWAAPLIGMALVAASGVVLYAQDNSTRRSETPRVFVPTDSPTRVGQAGKPIGGRWQVPSAFLAELRRRAAMATEEPQGWLLQDASYRASLGQGLADRRIEITSLTVRYDLQVFTPAARVRIPLSREGANLLPDGATLDGRAVQLEWEEGGQALVCQVDQPGAYELLLALRPAIHTAGEMSGFELAIPPLPNAMLELLVPAGMAGIEVPGAAGGLVWSDDHQRLLVRLGAASTLAVHWPHDGGGPGPQLEVDELLWLKVRPGSVVLDASLKYRVSGGQVRRLRLATDQRLRLLPPVGNGSPIIGDRIVPPASDVPGSPQTIELDLNGSVGDQLPLELSLLLTESSGVGNLRPPLFETLDAKSTRRWLAVSVDPALEFEVNGADRLEALAPADFATAWGLPDAQPILAYRLTGGDGAWSLATRPRQPRTTVKQATRYDFGRAGASVDFDAQLLTTAGHVFQHRLLVPAELEVEQLAIEADGGQRLARWARDEAGVITAFLDGRLTGPHTLSLRGRLSTPDSGEYLLPLFSIEGGEPLATAIELLRQPAVLVTLEKVEGLEESAPQTAETLPAHVGRRVASLTSSSGQPAVSVLLEPNEPRISGVQTTALRWESQAWSAQADLHLNVEVGLLDRLVLEVPEQWSGPFQVSPAATSELMDAAGDAGRRLLIRPRVAIQGRQRLTIRGPLRLEPGEGVAVPDVVPLGLERMSRLVLLPVQRGLEPIEWATTRLAPAPLPDGLNLGPLPPESFDVYRVTAARPRAVMKLVEEPTHAASVRLADIRLDWQEDGVCRGLAIFDLVPAGRLHCRLRMPTGARLVHLALAGLPAAAARQKNGDWLVPLGPQRLPQRLEVIWTASQPPPDRWRSSRLPVSVLALRQRVT
ncbi:MAG: hypothetical protein WD278_08860 [Pirellulales bacterium]